MESHAVFTPEMKKTHTILIPSMLPWHFNLLKAALISCGYKAELLDNTDRSVVETGLKYVNNDMWYPALLVIGQFINALESGKYDVNRVALIMTQTGGGCRASNYIHLLRKGLEQAGFGHVPVISLNLAGMEEQPGFDLSLKMIKRMLAAVVYGDVLMYLSNKTRPYEAVAGEADALAKRWLANLEELFQLGKAQSLSNIYQFAREITKDFAQLPVVAKDRIKVGVVGEIYIKYSDLGNNCLESFLQKQNCEYMLPGVMNFVMYGADTYLIDYKLYGGSLMKYGTAKAALWYLQRLEKAMRKALELAPFKAPASYAETKAMVKGVIGYGSNMGEGWLLTAEMLELAKNGYNNIICAQPFGCLPNHIAGRGMINKIKELVEDANILPIDYDASASKVNQENRIKLMLATAR
ncbi:MAG: 2-hydroxyacyl-CoA dehydratase [Phascolarctobacterium sp.]|nr:2-hydroxyacyl-CoA dehydratase [Phascolarctobacterium sp.]